VRNDSTTALGAQEVDHLDARLQAMVIARYRVVDRVVVDARSLVLLRLPVLYAEFAVWYDISLAIDR